jgi:hypothetical protein
MWRKKVMVTEKGSPSLMCSYITDNPRCIVIGVYPSPPCSTMSPSKKERKLGKKIPEATASTTVVYSLVSAPRNPQEND